MRKGLLQPFELGDLRLANRMVMAPMTRNRAEVGGEVPRMMVTYYDLDRAERALREGAADLVAFGVPFLANPDLVRRHREDLPLNPARPETFYVGGAEGYLDYPHHPEAVPA